MNIRINAKTFQLIYDTYWEPLCRFVCTYIDNPQTSKDIVQDAFLKLWNIRETVEINYLKGYLLSMARNAVLNYIRDNKGRVYFLEDFPGFHPSESPLTNEPRPADPQILLEKAKEGIESLPPKCKEIFLLSRRGNLTYKQIAEAKDISIKTVQNQMGIALKKIRDHISSNSR